MSKINLNNSLINTDNDAQKVSLEDFSITGGISPLTVNVYFRDIEEKLISHIGESDVVIGCVAWLTSEPILKALAKKPCSIIVQKEDFLRPDSTQCNQWKSNLHNLYNSINGLDRFAFAGGLISSMSYGGDPMIESIRCVGNHNSEKHPAFPRMHNKFLVFAKWAEDGEYSDFIQPYAVWTGSFNFTKNAGMSLENALYIEDDTVSNAYYYEYMQIAALSENLDWDSTWMAPEWRIGS